jgi:hypothetical protein
METLDRDVLLLAMQLSVLVEPVKRIREGCEFYHARQRFGPADGTGSTAGQSAASKAVAAPAALQ